MPRDASCLPGGIGGEGLEREQQRSARRTLKNRGAAGRGTHRGGRLPRGGKRDPEWGAFPVFTGLSECRGSGHYSWVLTRVSLIPVLSCDHLTVTLASLRGDKETPKSHSVGPPSKCYSGLRITPMRQVEGTRPFRGSIITQIGGGGEGVAGMKPVRPSLQDREQSLGSEGLK